MEKYELLWIELKNTLYRKKQQHHDKKAFNEIEDEMRKLEITLRIKEASSTIVLGKDEFAIALDISQYPFVYSQNCFSYFEYIGFDEGRGLFSVMVFTEPLGYITFEGEKLDVLLRHMYTLFTSQPVDMSNIDAGHHLFRFQEKVDGPISFTTHIPSDIALFWENA